MNSEFYIPAIKIGARNNANDKQIIQAIHDNASDLGATCAPVNFNEGIITMLNGKKIDFKLLAQKGAGEYARQEAWDILAATQVLGQVAQLCQSEMSELVHLDHLSKIMLELCEYIKAEISEMNSAAVMEANEPDHPKGFAMMSAKPETVPAEVKQVEPDRLNLSYAKSLGVYVPEMAVKFVARDEIKGYTFLWGNDKLTDLEVEYFTKNTNFWDGVMGKNTRPLTWDHAQDPTFKASPVVGQIVDFGDDEIGRWYVAKLERSHQYNKAISQLIKDGRLGTSSDSAPQYVERVKTGKATWLKTWAWFASALTDTPAEPRMIGSVEILKSLGVSLPDTVPQWQNYTATTDYLKIKYRIGD